jgi:hypothetical protein
VIVDEDDGDHREKENKRNPPGKNLPTEIVGAEPSEKAWPHLPDRRRLFGESFETEKSILLNLGL